MTTALTTRTSWSAYSRVAILLHWTIAFLILGSMTSGILHSRVDEATAAGIMSIHKPAGITILALSLVRLGWRATHGFPALPPGTPRLDAVAARATHVALYALMILVPVTGWMTVSGGPNPISYFGLADVPRLPVSRGVAELAHGAHTALTMTMFGLVALHVAGALKHHLIDRDDVLVRMLPLLRRKVGWRGTAAGSRAVPER